VHTSQKRIRFGWNRGRDRRASLQHQHRKPAALASPTTSASARDALALSIVLVVASAILSITAVAQRCRDGVAELRAAQAIASLHSVSHSVTQ
jgi:hypothetical protein